MLKSTELIDVQTLTSKRGPDMNMARIRHGLLNVHLDNQLSVLAIGGEGYNNGEWKVWDSIEKLNLTLNHWVLVNSTLLHARHSFGYLSMSTNMLCKP